MTSRRVRSEEMLRPLLRAELDRLSKKEGACAWKAREVLAWRIGDDGNRRLAPVGQAMLVTLLDGTVHAAASFQEEIPGAAAAVRAEAKRLIPRRHRRALGDGALLPEGA